MKRPPTRLKKEFETSCCHMRPSLSSAFPLAIVALLIPCFGKGQKMESTRPNQPIGCLMRPSLCLNRVSQLRQHTMVFGRKFGASTSQIRSSIFCGELAVKLCLPRKICINERWFAILFVSSMLRKWKTPSTSFGSARWLEKFGGRLSNAKIICLLDSPVFQTY